MGRLFYPQGIIRDTYTAPTAAVAGGVWTLAEQLQARKANTWPSKLDNDSFSVVMLHFDGANASTTFTDVNAGGAAKTWTANGNAQLSTTSPKFGTAAGLFDGTGDYITTPDSVDFTVGNGNFTIDFWFNVDTAGNGTTRYICGQGNAAINGTLGLLIRLDAANTLTGLASTTGSNLLICTSTSTFTTVGWNHAAFIREGTNLKLYINGVLEATTAISTTAVFDSSTVFAVGTAGVYVGGLMMRGRIDEFHFSKGIARWTANFSPPAFQYQP